MATGFILNLYFLISTGLSFEVDQFTNRAIIPDDCTNLLDKKVNDALLGAVNELNTHLVKNKMNCCPAGPQRELCLGTRKNEDVEMGKHYSVTNWWYGNKYSIYDKSDRLPPIYQLLNQKLVYGGSYDINSASTKTIMEDFAWNEIPEKCRVDAPSVSASIHKGQSLLTRLVSLEPEVMVNQTRIGIDKLGHSLGQGFLIMREQTLHKASYREAIDSQSEEDGIYGCGATGVYSYADVAANMAGADFWFDVFNGRAQSPIESETQQPSDVYIRCEDIGNGIFRYRRTHKIFSWKNYVTNAWDEGINCSTTCKSAMGGNYSWVPDKNFVASCPLDEQKCLELGKGVKEGTLYLSGISRICRELYARRSTTVPAEEKVGRSKNQ